MNDKEKIEKRNDNETIEWYISAIKSYLVLEHNMLLKDATSLLEEEYQLDRIIREDNEEYIIKNFNPKMIAAGLVTMNKMLDQPVRTVSLEDFWNENNKISDPKKRRSLAEILGGW